jgi:pimeloyl-ACP methyl ester carboxylesterase
MAYSEYALNEQVIYNVGSRRLFAVITTPVSSPRAFEMTCVILLNAGAIHRIGPNRIYVKLSRRLASEGIMTCRVDLSGQGDSPFTTSGSCLSNVHLEDMRCIMDYIESEKAVSHFILAGICSGADNALCVAISDPRVQSLILINGGFLPDDILKAYQRQVQLRSVLRYYLKNMCYLKCWKRFVTGQSSHVRSIIELWKGNKALCSKSDVREKPEDIEYKWAQLIKRKVSIYLIFAEGSTSLDLFNVVFHKKVRKLIRSGVMVKTIISSADHVFTPIAKQEELIRRIVECASMTCMRFSKH